MNRDRPEQLVVVAGTGTEVGKTWVAASLCRALVSAGVRVSARKPAQSFEADDPTTDADELADATGEDPLTICPPHRRYPVAMAPPMAADVLGSPRITVADLAVEVSASWRTASGGDLIPAELGLVELAGGVRSPAAHDGDGVDLAAALEPDWVLVVADAGLGTINSVRLTAAALDGIARLVIHLNRYDATTDLHRLNRAWLAETYGFEVTTSIPELTELALSVSRGGS